MSPSRQKLNSNSNDDKIIVGRTQLTAQTTRINEVMQTIAERDDPIVRLKREKAE